VPLILEYSARNGVLENNPGLLWIGTDQHIKSKRLDRGAGILQNTHGEQKANIVFGS
jgi:hypothetical protein